MKPSLSFYTNNPTPYQLDFFDALKNYFKLRVIYFTVRTSDRKWNLSLNGSGGYDVVILNDNWLARQIQRKNPAFHFNLKIVHELKKDVADFVVINGTYWMPNVWLALTISRFRGKKVFFWNEPLFPTKNRIKFFIQFVFLFPVRYCTDALLAIGCKAVEAYQAYGYKKPIYNVPYNINMNLFSKEQLSQEKLEKLVSLYKANGETVFLTSGSLIHRKGIDTVIKSFLKIPESCNARLIILGDGSQKEDLQKLCADSNRVHFLGFQEKEDIPYYFRVSDIFIFASRYDGWALVINEAVAADLPIISSDKVGAAIDKIKDGFNGFVCSVEDVEAYQKCMMLLITNSRLKEDIIRNMQPLKETLSSDYNAKLLYGICTGYK